MYPPFFLFRIYIKWNAFYRQDNGGWSNVQSVRRKELLYINSWVQNPMLLHLLQKVRWALASPLLHKPIKHNKRKETKQVVINMECEKHGQDLSTVQIKVLLCCQITYLVIGQKLNNNNNKKKYSKPEWVAACLWPFLWVEDHGKLVRNTNGGQMDGRSSCWGDWGSHAVTEVGLRRLVVGWCCRVAVAVGLLRRHRHVGPCCEHELGSAWNAQRKETHKLTL